MFCKKSPFFLPLRFAWNSLFVVFLGACLHSAGEHKCKDHTRRRKLLCPRWYSRSLLPIVSCLPFWSSGGRSSPQNCFLANFLKNWPFLDRANAEQLQTSAKRRSISIARNGHFFQKSLKRGKHQFFLGGITKKREKCFFKEKGLLYERCARASKKKIPGYNSSLPHPTRRLPRARSLTSLHTARKNSMSSLFPNCLLCQ